MKYEDLKHYTNFQKFFTRELKDGARQITNPQDLTTLCSPCDGRVLTCGEISTMDSTIDCVKGRSYRLDEFMFGVKDDSDKTVPSLIKRVLDKGNKLFYTVIYLAPSDYHRFHSPGVYVAESRRHIAGYLDPVKPAYVNSHKDVFKNNERVNLFGQWNQGFFLQSFVGALNVGSIKLKFDETLRTNQSNPVEPYHYDLKYKSSSSVPAVSKIGQQASPLEKYLYQNEVAPEVEIKERLPSENWKTEQGVSLLKGEELGWFEMGSTIVLIFEGPKSTKLNIQEGGRVWLGQEIVTTA